MEMTDAQFDQYWKAMDETGTGKFFFSATPLLL